MGAIYLLSMPEVLAAAGLDVATWPGWQTLARSSGGYDDVLGVQVHHTGSTASPENDMRYMWENSAYPPIGAIHLARSGKVTVGAAGATNTSGRGGPLGTIPKDQANKYVISVEAANAGNGEPWTPDQIRVYPILVNALVKAYDLPYTSPGIHAHHEWTSRKIDPAGPSPWATGADKWDMNKFRADVQALNPLPAPKPPQNIEDFTEEELMVALIIIPPNNEDVGPNPPWLVHINGATTYIGSEAYTILRAAGVPQKMHNKDQYTNYRAAAGL